MAPSTMPRKSNLQRTTMSKLQWCLVDSCFSCLITHTLAKGALLYPQPYHWWLIAGLVVLSVCVVWPWLRGTVCWWIITLTSCQSCWWGMWFWCLQVQKHWRGQGSEHLIGINDWSKQPNSLVVLWPVTCYSTCASNNQSLMMSWLLESAV